MLFTIVIVACDVRGSRRFDPGLNVVGLATGAAGVVTDDLELIEQDGRVPVSTGGGAALVRA